MKLQNYCHQCSRLVDANSVASSAYHHATTTLLQLCGRGESEAFADAKKTCESALENCRRTQSALRSHRLVHSY